MASQPLLYNNKPLYVHSATSNPDFGGTSVLSTDSWDYVSLWLRRSSDTKANFYWQQAREFYNASINLSATASPLTSYYCCLNATKALLIVKGRTFTDYHGVTGSTRSGKKSLQSEIIKIQSSGVLAELCNFLSQPVTSPETFTLKDIFFNLPFIHRAFALTYKSASELFIPLKNPMFVRKENSNEAWFSAEVNSMHINRVNLRRVLPKEYEVDDGVTEKCIIRRKKRFSWQDGSAEVNVAKLTDYHKKIRFDVIPIFASTNTWYLKKNIHGRIQKSLGPLIYAAMHKLSELSRYDPLSLERHLECQHNWVLTEFLRIAPAQFISNIACEITGKEFVRPYADRLPGN